MAAAEEAINPADADEQWEFLLAGEDDLRAKVRIAAGRVISRMHLVMTVMFAVRGHLIDAGTSDRQARPKPGPPGVPASTRRPRCTASSPSCSSRTPTSSPYRRRPRPWPCAA